MNCKPVFPAGTMVSIFALLGYYRVKWLKGPPKIPGSFDHSLQFYSLGWKGCPGANPQATYEAIRPPYRGSHAYELDSEPEGWFLISYFTLLTTRAGTS